MSASKHPWAKARARALSELAGRHPEEFRELYEGHVLAEGVTTLDKRMSADREMLVGLIADNPGLTLSQLAELSGLSLMGLQNWLRRLEEDGEIVRPGRGWREGYFLASEGVLNGEQKRQARLDAILQLIRDEPGISGSDIALRAGLISESDKHNGTLHVYLCELADAGLIVMPGSGNARIGYHPA